jgi:hypothetical protein
MRNSLDRYMYSTTQLVNKQTCGSSVILFPSSSSRWALQHFLPDKCEGDHPDEAQDDPAAAGQRRRAGGEPRRVVVAAVVHGVTPGVVGVQHRGAGAPSHGARHPSRWAVTGARHPRSVTARHAAARRPRAVTGAETARVSCSIDAVRTQPCAAHCICHLWRVGDMIMLMGDGKM